MQNWSQQIKITSNDLCEIGFNELMIKLSLTESETYKI